MGKDSGDRVMDIISRLRNSSSAGNFVFGYKKVKESRPTVLEEPSFASLPELIGKAKEIESWSMKKLRKGEDFEIEEIAYEFRASPKTMSDFFSSHEGSPFRNWKAGIKVEIAAKILLEEQDLPVSEISQKAGFNDKSNFHRMFKQKMGCTPKEWRDTGGHPGIDDPTPQKP